MRFSWIFPHFQKQNPMKVLTTASQLEDAPLQPIKDATSGVRQLLWTPGPLQGHHILWNLFFAHRGQFCWEMADVFGEWLWGEKDFSACPNHSIFRTCRYVFEGYCRCLSFRTYPNDILWSVYLASDVFFVLKLEFAETISFGHLVYHFPCILRHFMQFLGYPPFWTHSQAAWSTNNAGP